MDDSMNDSKTKIKLALHGSKAKNLIIESNETLIAAVEKAIFELSIGDEKVKTLRSMMPSIWQRIRSREMRAIAKRIKSDLFIARIIAHQAKPHKQRFEKNLATLKEDQQKTIENFNPLEILDAQAIEDVQTNEAELLDRIDILLAENDDLKNKLED